MLGVGPSRAAVLAILALLVLVALLLLASFSMSQLCGQAENLLVYQSCLSGWRDQALAALAVIGLVVGAGLAVLIWRRRRARLRSR